MRHLAPHNQFTSKWRRWTEIWNARTHIVDIKWCLCTFGEPVSSDLLCECERSPPTKPNTRNANNTYAIGRVPPNDKRIKILIRHSHSVRRAKCIIYSFVFFVQLSLLMANVVVAWFMQSSCCKRKTFHASHSCSKPHDIRHKSR